MHVSDRFNDLKNRKLDNPEKLVHYIVLHLTYFVSFNLENVKVLPIDDSTIFASNNRFCQVITTFCLFPGKTIFRTGKNTTLTTLKIATGTHVCD